MGGKAQEHDIRPGALEHGNPAQYNYDAIAGFIKGADPSVLEGIGLAYAHVQAAFQKAEQGLAQHVRRLNSAWQANSQELGIAEMRRLTTTAAGLASASQKFQSAMDEAHATIKLSQAGMPAKTQLDTSWEPQPGTPDGSLLHYADDKKAQEHLAKTNSGLVSAYQDIPSTLTVDILQRGETPFGTGPSSGGSSAGSESPSGGGLGGAGGNLDNPGSGVGLTPADSANELPSGLLPSGAASPSGGDSAPGGHGGGNPSDLEGVPSGGGKMPGPVTPSPGSMSNGPNSGVIPSGTGGVSPGNIGILPPGLGGVSGSPRGQFSNGRGGAFPGQPGGLTGAGWGGSPGGATSAIPGTGGRISPPRLNGVLGGNLPGVGGSLGNSGRVQGMDPLPPGGVIRNSTSGTMPPGGRSAGSAESVTNNATGGRSGTVGPMGLGSSGGTQEEHERSNWIVDDEDLWAEDADTAPRVIGE